MDTSHFVIIIRFMQFNRAYFVKPPLDPTTDHVGPASDPQVTELNSLPEPMCRAQIDEFYEFVFYFRPTLTTETKQI